MPRARIPDDSRPRNGVDEPLARSVVLEQLLSSKTGERQIVCVPLDVVTFASLAVEFLMHRRIMIDELLSMATPLR